MTETMQEKILRIDRTTAEVNSGIIRDFQEAMVSKGEDPDETSPELKEAQDRLKEALKKFH